MPPRAAAAPRRPKKRSPNISARLTTFGPGSTWASASIATNSSRLSQRFRSTKFALGHREHAAEALKREAVEGQEQLARRFGPGLRFGRGGRGCVHGRRRSSARPAQTLSPMAMHIQARPTKLRLP